MRPPARTDVVRFAWNGDESSSNILVSSLSLITIYSEKRESISKLEVHTIFPWNTDESLLLFRYAFLFLHVEVRTLRQNYLLKILDIDIIIFGMDSFLSHSTTTLPAILFLPIPLISRLSRIHLSGAQKNANECLIRLALQRPLPFISPCFHGSEILETRDNYESAIPPSNSLHLPCQKRKDTCRQSRNVGIKPLISTKKSPEIRDG